MVDEKMIQAAVAEKLKKIGISVTASEIKEGFNKPTAFISVIPTASERLNYCRERMETTVTIKYIPAVETVEECAETAGKIRKGFFYETLDVGERRLTIENMEFDCEDNALYVYFDLNFIQEIPDTEEYEPMNNLEMGGDI